VIFRVGSENRGDGGNRGSGGGGGGGQSGGGGGGSCGRAARDKLRRVIGSQGPRRKSPNPIFHNHSKRCEEQDRQRYCIRMRS
jgi:hypothetical protein